MMNAFFRYPSTPHLSWLAHGTPARGDKLLSEEDALRIFREDVIVEEKTDGANIGMSLSKEGHIQIQNRGQYLTYPYHGQFARLAGWLSQHDGSLREVLTQDLIIFGEWCAARHSIGYDRLPDWFLVFDVYDRVAARFWSTRRRDSLAARADLATAPILLRGSSNLAALKQLLSTASSRFRNGPMEGLIVRCDAADWCEIRAKIVRADFVQSIDDHWRRRHIEWNRLARYGEEPAE